MSTTPDKMPAARVPGHVEPPNVIARFVTDQARPWDRERVPMPVPLTVGLWSVLAADVAVGGWLAAVVGGSVSCTGFPCALTTWWHPGTLLLVAVAGAVLLLGAAAAGRGLTRLSARTLPLALAGAGCGLAAVSGVLALAALGITVTLIGSVLLVAVVDGI